MKDLIQMLTQASIKSLILSRDNFLQKGIQTQNGGKWAYAAPISHQTNNVLVEQREYIFFYFLTGSGIYVEGRIR